MQAMGLVCPDDVVEPVIPEFAQPLLAVAWPFLEHT
jgi:hypothetical protein